MELYANQFRTKVDSEMNKIIENEKTLNKKMENYRIREASGSFFPEIKYIKYSFFGKPTITWNGMTTDGYDWDRLAEIGMHYPLAKYDTYNEAEGFLKKIINWQNNGTVIHRPYLSG